LSLAGAALVLSLRWFWRSLTLAGCDTSLVVTLAGASLVLALR